MKVVGNVLLIAAVGFGGFLLVGCNPKEKIKLRYERPAAIQIPVKVKRVGVASFGGDSKDDIKWGSVASDHLASALEEHNQKKQRYVLVDRRRLKAILDERDLQLAVCDSATAGEVGKIADVHAMIYGSVKTTSSSRRKTKKKFDIISRRMKTTTYTHYNCTATVNFTLDDISTAKALASSTATRTFDSEKDSSKFAGLLGLGGSDDGQSKMDEIVLALIDECVEEFLSKICSYEVVVEEELQPGKGKKAAKGTKFAAAGEYADALKYYESGISANPDDHECVFNAGVMCEALGDFSKAEKYYQRALDIEPKKRYIRARKRVRVESSK